MCLNRHCVLLRYLLLAPLQWKEWSVPGDVKCVASSPPKYLNHVRHSLCKEERCPHQPQSCSALEVGVIQGEVTLVITCVCMCSTNDSHYSTRQVAGC